MNGRRYSEEIHYCHDFGSAGPLRSALHSYRAVAPDDVEPVDLCPRCQDEVFSVSFVVQVIRREAA